jgi:hypothetical protein
MQGDEIRALRLQREQGLSSHVFMTERDGPMTPKAFHALFGRIMQGDEIRALRRLQREQGLSSPPRLGGRPSRSRVARLPQAS